jgi:hypothetical protein
MMLKFRPVNCDTLEPVDAKAGARARADTTTGTASTDKNNKDDDNNTKNGDAAQDTSTGGGGGGGTIFVYSEAPSAGWTWMMYADQWSLPIREGWGAARSTDKTHDERAWN